MVPLRELLTPISGKLTDPDAAYPIAGLYSFGRGLLQRDTIRGVDTKYATLTQLSEGTSSTASSGPSKARPPWCQHNLQDPGCHLSSLCSRCEATWIADTSIM
jgi:hypothetical protein